MKRIVVAAVAVLITTAPAWACDPAAHRDQTRALERQAESLQRLERIERDRFKAEDRARRNASR